MQRQITRISVCVNYAGPRATLSPAPPTCAASSPDKINPIYFALGTTLPCPQLQPTSQPRTPEPPPPVSRPSPFLTPASEQHRDFSRLVGHHLPRAHLDAAISRTTDIWGSQSANAVYHSLPTLRSPSAHRMGLTLNVNYTYSHNIDDAGTQRSGWAIPGSVLLSGQSWKHNRIDRSTSANSSPENLTAYGVYDLPFGKGKIGGDHSHSHPCRRLATIGYLHLRLRHSARDHFVRLLHLLPADRRNLHAGS